MRTAIKVRFDGNARWATVTVGIGDVEVSESEQVRLTSGDNVNDQVAISAATVRAVQVATSRATGLIKALTA